MRSQLSASFEGPQKKMPRQVQTVDVADEFQRRRRETGRATRPWLFAGAVAALLAWWAGDFSASSSAWRLPFGIAGTVVFAAALLRIVYIVRALYRCPACDQIPMSGTFGVGTAGFSFEEGVDLKPKKCGHCGANLSVDS